MNGSIVAILLKKVEKFHQTVSGKSYPTSRQFPFGLRRCEALSRRREQKLPQCERLFSQMTLFNESSQALRMRNANVDKTNPCANNQ